ncbi:MAG TPA: SDR family NAD(P)-dependent oxidoreductase [Terriglobales bacterium]|nr:SDR family NAD(P)-dependent oxidoreductase [Terriglobales bacterium]
MGPPQTLIGKVALITGASRGIGLAIAMALAREGCNLVVTWRDRKALDAAQRRLKLAARAGAPAPQILAHVADVRDPKSVAALFAAVKKQFGRLDILINNAGISHAMAEVERLPLATWREVIETNLTGTFLITQAALPLLRRGGTIINNLSVAATRVFAGQSAYCAAKHGALGLTRTLREELRPRGIRVIALMPGATNTDIWNQFWPEAPRRRMLRPETVAQAVLDALLLPPESTVEEITLMPTGGAL